MSKKCEKEEKAERDKIKKSLAKDNQDGACRKLLAPYFSFSFAAAVPLFYCSSSNLIAGTRPCPLLPFAGARIHAQNAIRNKTNAQNYLRLSSRVDAVASRLESAIKMQQVTKSMGNVVRGMDKVLGSMNVEQISKVMDSFEKSFEDMDVRSEYIEGAMNSSTTGTMPEEQVETLMQEVATEHDLKFTDQFATPDLSAGEAKGAEAAAKPVAAAQAGGGGGGGSGGGGGGGGSAEDDLEERLRRLRNS